MAFLKSYRHDIFVSYSLVNDRMRLDEDPWVRRFVEELETRLQNILPADGKEVKSYLAGKGDLKDGQQLASCLDEAKKSALFLIIGSPRYLDAWPMSEIRAFTDGAAKQDRVFIAEMHPLDEGYAYPEIIGDPLRSEFWIRTARRAYSPLADTQGEFGARIAELSLAIKERLIALRSAESPARGPRPPDPNLRTVLLARVTDDLVPKAAALRTYLEQFDIPVIPEAEWEAEGASFRTEFEDGLRKAAVVVQLLVSRI